jgi:hypothetical protein
MERPAVARPQPHLKSLTGAALAAAAALTVLFVAGVPLPDLDGALEDASRTLGAWAYPSVAGFALLETGAFVGLLVPGETAVVVGGVVAQRGEVELAPLIALVWAGAAAGDLVSFLLGRRLGRPFLEHHGARMHLGPERLGRVERFYDRHGARRSWSAASPAWCGRSPRSWRAPRGWRCGASCRGAPPARCSGPPPSPWSATASPSRSPSRATRPPGSPWAPPWSPRWPSWPWCGCAQAACGVGPRMALTASSAKRAPTPAPSSAPARMSSGKCTRR